ncbi:hypothetical protein JYG33_16055 [Alcaligenes sp. SORT26]|uniref:TetR/AcrR family transcriptional regulator n=1 Tax=Alcaligenes sp. SORT26 TaxID=2813780 RepID=UPI001A9D340F|nr:hypothetical protein [Alcaligenes sp. SORT26]QTB99449.1 hypothetical protein JYG33_16055 [Alcaligenes sp. SORT26]
MTAAKPRPREELLLRLVNALADQPRVSMGQLAGLVGLSRATLCRYFPSREAMMMEIFEEGVNSAEQAIKRAHLCEGDAQEAIKRLIEELLPIVDLYMYVERQLQVEEYSTPRTEAVRQALITQFQQWQESGALRLDLSAVWLCESLFALLSKAARLIRAGRLARHDAPHNVHTLLWSGIVHP